MNLKPKSLKRRVEKQLKDFGLHDWIVTVTVYSDEESSDIARVAQLGEYRQCHIYFNEANIENEKVLEDATRHECLHVLMWPWDIFASNLINIVGDDPAFQSLLNQYMLTAHEQSVRNMEVLLDRLK